MLSSLVSYLALVKEVEFEIVTNKDFIVLKFESGRSIKLHLNEFNGEELADMSSEWLSGGMKRTHNSTFALLMNDRADVLHTILTLELPDNGGVVKEAVLKCESEQDKDRGMYMNYTYMFDLLF